MVFDFLPLSPYNPAFNRVAKIYLNFASVSIRDLFFWRLRNAKVNYSPAFNCRERGGEVGESQIKGDKRWKVNVNHSKFTSS